MEDMDMSMTSESDEKMMSKNGMDSSPVDEANSGGNVGPNGPLKKGPWTSAEDAILVEYVTKHGEGNWNAVQKHSGLARCGKSCRLRWANHLRPDLKKGAFTPEEERRIIELHAKMGNKWARMAAELPGRTDNEIKNYWNTRIKRRQRAGLPIYPPDICIQTLNENQQSDNMTTFSSRETDFMGINNFEIPALEFKSLELNQHFYPQSLPDIPASTLLDIPASTLLAQGLHSSYTNTKPFLSSMHHPSKRLRGTESFFPGLDVCNAISVSSQYQNEGLSQIALPYIFSSPYDHSSNSNHASSSNVLLPGSHADLNGNPSSSEPAWAMKLELPSLQTHNMGSWGSPSSSPLPSLDCVDTLIQMPLAENTQSSPRNSGLLDAVLYESQIMRNSNSFPQQPSHGDTSSQDLNEREWEAFGEPVSPLGHSSSSVFSDGTPASGNSLDEPQSVDTTEGYKIKEESNDPVPLQYDDDSNTTNQMLFSRPDYMLASDCFVTKNDPIKDHSLLEDAIGTFLRDDPRKDCNQTDTSAAASGQGHGHDSYAWNTSSHFIAID